MSHLSPARAPGLRARAAVLLATVLGAGLVVLALGTGPAHAAQHAITIKQYMFMPRSMSITAGDTITWTNQDSAGHDVEVTSGPASFHSPMLAKGQSWSYTFAAAGTYSYVCSVHPDMTATVTVAPAPRPEPQHTSQPVTHAPAASAAAGGAPVARAPSAPAHRPGRKAARSSGSTATSGSSATPAAAPVVTPGSDAALDPLLLVAGVAVAVVVFCLLLLTSRPERPLLAPAGGSGSAGEDHAGPDSTPTAVDLAAVGSADHEYTPAH